MTCALLAETVKMTENPLQGFFVLMRSKELFQRWWHGVMKAAFGDQFVAMYTDTDSVHIAFQETEAASKARVAALEAGTPHALYFNANESLKDPRYRRPSTGARARECDALTARRYARARTWRGRGLSA